MSEKSFLITMGERVALKRKERKLTQEQMAEKVGVSLQTISNIECGKKSTRPENIAKICIALNTTADYIILGKKDEQQIKGIMKTIASLPEDRYRAIENIISFL